MVETTGHLGCRPPGLAGRVQTVTDPRGLVTKTDYDLVGRSVRTVAAFTANPLFTDPNWNQVTKIGDIPNCY